MKNKLRLIIIIGAILILGGSFVKAFFKIDLLEIIIKILTDFR